MKKSNAITLLSFAALIAVVVLTMVLWRPSGTVDDTTAALLLSSEPSESSSSVLTEPSSGRVESEADTALTQPKTVSMKDALFIGDSRTVGLSEYSGIEGADFFATVGMNVYNIHKDTVSVPSVGKVTLTQLLGYKKYGKIYIMLGINELGYPLENTVAKYKELIDFVREKQPGARIFIQANLHVTKSRSDSDKVINNPAVDELNSRLAGFADGKTVFYLDANPLFDDNTGSLSSDKAGDSAHPYAKYYSQWGDWILEKTEALMEEG